MKKLSKALALLLTVCMACPPMALAASKAASKKQVITIWDEAEAGLVKPMQDEVNKLANSGIIVKFQRKDNMNNALKLVGNDPKSAPDMYLLAHDKTGTFAQMGILAPVTDFISKSEMKDLLPLTVNAGKYQGKNYQLPIYFETQMLIYNKKLMKKVPKTTDEWLAYMKANTKNGSYALVEQHSTSYYAAAWMHAFGATIISDKGQPQLNTKAMKNALAYHKKFVPYEPADGEWNTITALFNAGKAQAIISGPWLIPSIKAAHIDYGVAPLPVVNSTKKRLSPYAGVQGLFVLKNSEKSKKQAITEVLRELLKPDVGIALGKSADEAPANSKCYNYTVIRNNTDLMSMMKTAENAIPMQNIPEMDVMWTATDNMLAAINKNNVDINTACAKAQQTALDGIQAMK